MKSPALTNDMELRKIMRYRNLVTSDLFLRHICTYSYGAAAVGVK